MKLYASGRGHSLHRGSHAPSPPIQQLRQPPMIKAIIPKKIIAPIRHVAAVPTMILLRTTLLSKSLPPMKARSSKTAVIATAMDINLTMPRMFSQP
jgi:hypothetical protein